MNGRGQFDSNETARAVMRPARRLDSLRFFYRYPIFLLFFGPPLFRDGLKGFDTSQAHFDIWNVLQIALLGAIALRATLRLLSKETIFLIKRVRSLFTYMILLGVLFSFSVLYSPGKAVSAEFCFLYFVDLVCIVEFVVDAYTDPPDWMQCIFKLRLIALLLCLIALLCLPTHPAWVLSESNEGVVRLMGGGICSMGAVLPLIILVSAYSFLYKLESRAKSAFLFLFAGVGLLVSQMRGAELVVLMLLLVTVSWWAKSRRSAHFMVAGGLTLAVLGVGILFAVGGTDRLWNKFNRGQDTFTILTASGRTVYWRDVLVYCVSHPWGMGYIAGVRHMQFGIYKDNLHANLNAPGGTDNSYMQALTDVGWISLGAYLLILGKLFEIAWGLAGKKGAADDRNPRGHHAMRCLLLLYSSCLLSAMESSDFVTPLRQEFYLQNVLIAILLGAFTTATVASRARAYGQAVMPADQRLAPC